MARNDQKEPNLTTSTETKPQQEPKGLEGNMGGQPALNVKAGVQSTGRGGVLVEKGQYRQGK